MIDGRIISNGLIDISLTSESFMFGCGVFETVRIINGEPEYWPEHLERLEDGCQRMGMPLPERDTLTRELSVLLENAAPELSVLRLTCILDKGMTRRIFSLSGARYKQEQYEKGFSLYLSSCRRNGASPLSGIKTINYMENILARRQAIEYGFDDALLLDGSGNLAETSAANIFFYKKGVLCTPDLRSGILPGIMRRQVINYAISMEIPVRTGAFDIMELLEATEVFVTNSLVGVMPVCSIDKKNFQYKNDGLVGTLMQKFVII